MTSEVLTKLQCAFLSEVGKSNLIEQFYLSGGTPLAECYLKHRYSEDLDFFSEQEFQVLSIDVFLKSVKELLGITDIDFQQSFNRNLFFCHTESEVLKVEFTLFSVPVDSIDDIAVNKLFSIYQRTNARDFVDMFFLVKEKGLQVDELIKMARIKFDWHIDPLQFGSQFVRVDEAVDFPCMLVPLDKAEMHAFFKTEAKKLRTEVIEL
jgi:predicted nucleotidyltransferase component of viral defense system